MLEKDEALELQRLANAVRAAQHADDDRFGSYVRSLGRRAL